MSSVNIFAEIRKPRKCLISKQKITLIKRAFLEGERIVWVRNFRVACILASIFTPAGSSWTIFGIISNLFNFLSCV